MHICLGEVLGRGEVSFCTCNTNGRYQLGCHVMFSEHAPSDQYPIDYDLGFFIYLLQQQVLKMAKHSVIFVFTLSTYSALTVSFK